MSNGGGPVVMAADPLSLAQGRLASLSGETLTKLDVALPKTWSRSNPVGLIAP